MDDSIASRSNLPELPPASSGVPGDFGQIDVSLPKAAAQSIALPPAYTQEDREDIDILLESVGQLAACVASIHAKLVEKGIIDD